VRERLTAMTFGVFWFVAYLVTFGHKWIPLEPIGEVFKVGARLDVTFIGHVTGFFLLCYIHPALSIFAAIGFEVFDGFRSSQGADIIDGAADLGGIWLWFRIAGSHLFDWRR
jgi:hypothetical protein